MEDILLVEGNNQLNVQMVPIAPPFDPWSYDFNGDGYISHAEAISATWDYFDGKITKSQVEQVEYLYRNNIYRWE